MYKQKVVLLLVVNDGGECIAVVHSSTILIVLHIFEYHIYL